MDKKQNSHLPLFSLPVPLATAAHFGYSLVMKAKFLRFSNVRIRLF
jgi:hypothetical protein